MIRSVVVFFLTCIFSMGCSFAQAPDTGAEKTSTRILQKLVNGTPQDLIVVFDDNTIQKEALTRQAGSMISSRDKSMIAYKAARLSSLKSSVLSAAGTGEIAVLKQYNNLPMSFLRIKSRHGLDVLLADSRVAGMYENHIMHRTGLAQSLPLIGQPQAIAAGDQGSGTAVAVLDQRVDYTNSAFGSCTSPGTPSNCKVVVAMDAPGLANDGLGYQDSHGTNVAATVVAVAPGTKIVSINVFNGASALDSDIIDAIDWCITNQSLYNIVAINLSLGDGSDTTASTTASSYYQTFVSARAAGMLPVAAAGNDGFTNGMGQPAAVTGAVSVGAVYDGNEGGMTFPLIPCTDSITAADQVTCFSNSASFLTVFAPGCQDDAGFSNGTYFCGTSQATPHAAGSVAILRAAFPTDSLTQTVTRLTDGVPVTDIRNGVTIPRLYLPNALALASSGSSFQVDIRTYVPFAAARGGYQSFLRIINTGAATSPITVALIDPVTGVVGAPGRLTAALAAGAAATFTAQQVEAAMGVSLAAGLRPRIRVGSQVSVGVQSFLLQPGGVFNEVSAAQSGTSIVVPDYIPAAAVTAGYESYLRVINTGNAPTALTIARIDPATGLVGTAVSLTGALAAGAASTFSANQIEAALGQTLAASDRPQMQVTAASSTVDAQSFYIQPGGAFTNISSSQSGTIVNVRTYVPAAVIGYTSFLKIINNSTSSAPVFATVINGQTGVMGASGPIVIRLGAGDSVTLNSTQVEQALGVSLSAADRPRLAITSAGNLTVQSYLLQPGGAFNEMSAAQTGTSATIGTYIPAADAPGGYTSFVRVINTGMTATPIMVSIIDPVTGVTGSPATLISELPAGAAWTLSSAQFEQALGTTIAQGTRPRILFSASGGNVIEVQSFLIQPGGAFTNVSGGQ